MDEKNRNGGNPPAEKSSAGGKKNLDAFFEELESSGALEGGEARRSGKDRYDPDYIDLSDYEKSETGFVSLREEKAGVRSFDSSRADGARPDGRRESAGTKKGEKPAAASSAGGRNGQKKKGKKGKDGENRHRGWRVFGKLVLCVFCIGVIAVCAVTVAAAMYLARETADDDALLDLNSLKLSFATRLMAQNENGEWYEYQRIYEDANRVWIEYDDLSKELIDVTVSSEDQRFWTHKGVDIKRTLVAFLNEYVLKGYFYENTQGGSTITQQLIKNITGEAEVEGSSGALRKLKEIYRAFMLERRYSKNQILEAYLNTVNFGGKVEGIESAANYYFDTSASDLSYAQSAAIVCITKFPTANNPFINPDENQHQREDVVLWTMHERGEISDTDYQAALSESKTFVFDTPGGSAASSTEQWSWFTETVRSEVMRDLQEINGMSADEAYDMFYNQGLTIYLTIDPAIQKVVESVAYDEQYWSSDYKFNSSASSSSSNTRIWPELEYEYERDENGDYVLDENGDRVEVLAKNQVQAAMVVLNYKGELLGVAGSIREKDGNLGLNRAVGTIQYVDANRNPVDRDDPNMYTYEQVGGVRQTGSSMKPIAVYAPAVELDKVTMSSLFRDQPVTTIGGQPWPRNYSRSYGAPVTVHEGLVRSLNTTAAGAMMLIGYDYSFDFLTTSLGITTLVDDVPSPYDHSNILSDRGLSLGLGGLSVGVSPYEMAAAYAVFGNGGTYYEPHCYTRVVNARGDIVLNKEEAIEVNKAISDETAMIMNKMMQGVTTSAFDGATGYYMRRGYDNTRFPIAGKTGTSSDDNDFWAIGMNPYYVMAVWEGYDEYESLPNLRPHCTQQAFALVMSQISAELDTDLEFPVAEDILVRQYCTASGDLASDACPDTRTGYYKPGTLPPVCDHTLVPSEEELAAMENQPS